MEVSNFLLNHKKVKSVYYPGLESHPDHELSSRQMRGYGGMLSFELANLDEAILFTRKIKLIKSLKEKLEANSVILIKGSRFMKMEEVVASLEK